MIIVLEWTTAFLKNAKHNSVKDITAKRNLECDLTSIQTRIETSQVFPTAEGDLLSVSSKARFLQYQEICSMCEYI